MALTIQNTTGDGVQDNLVQTTILMPDAAPTTGTGATFSIAGRVQPQAGAVQGVAFTSLVTPVLPASGTTYWNVQIDMTTGVATVQSSAASDPVPINANNVVVFRQQLVPGSGTESSNATDGTPDDY